MIGSCQQAKPQAPSAHAVEFSDHTFVVDAAPRYGHAPGIRALPHES